jgi:hypothetical protein
LVTLYFRKQAPIVYRLNPNRRIRGNTADEVEGDDDEQMGFLCTLFYLFLFAQQKFGCRV